MKLYNLTGFVTKLTQRVPLVGTEGLSVSSPCLPVKPIQYNIDRHILIHPNKKKSFK
jgi:hypothetical protein